MAASDIRREDVLKAIAEYEELKQEQFLKQYEFGPAAQYRLVHDGKFYDSKAIVGVAHGFATGEFWTAVRPFGGIGSSSDAVPVLRSLGFYVDDGTLFRIEGLQPDLTHGKRAPYQYVLLLWAFARVRDGLPRLVNFNDVRQELAELLEPFAIAKTAPDPAMPWAALANAGGLWELEREGLSPVTDLEVKRLNMAGGLFPTKYLAVQNSPEFLDKAVEVVARFIGDDPAFPWLLERLGVDGVPSPASGSSEVADATAAVEEIANPRRKFGRRFSAAENKEIEEQAVRVVRKHFKEVLGYETEDVGATKSYDVHATRGDSVIKVEVKGTSTDGAEIVLTANEVSLHLADHPNNALAVVRRIKLERTDDGPVASGGELELMMGWALDQERLKPIAYRYQTGL